jgi:hypothetical protein
VLKLSIFNGFKPMEWFSARLHGPVFFVPIIREMEGFAIGSFDCNPVLMLIAIRTTSNIFKKNAKI